VNESAYCEGVKRMEKTIGFIGCGNMGRAMVEGIMKAKLVNGDQMIVSNAHPEKLQELGNTYDFYIADNETVARHADIIFLAVKPHLYAKIIDEIKDKLKEDAILVSIAAGITLQDMQDMTEGQCRVVRAMPNTPALVSEGMSAVCFQADIDEEQRAEILTIFESFGKARVIEERLMESVIALSGSSPAYVFQFIEAMGDGGVMLGMPRKEAYFFAAQAVLGAAKMVLETEMHPAELKDMVCSPAGTTIEAVAKLEEMGLRSAVIEAMRACADKNRLMNEK